MDKFTAYSLIHKARVDDSKMSVSAVLTYPIVDAAGDYIEPTGGDYTQHKAYPWVGLEHYRYSTAGDGFVYPDDENAGAPVVVGWARESLSKPGAPYAVQLKQFELKGQRHTLPVGTTYFDQNSRVSSQVFAMIKEDALPGVSLELVAPDNYKPRVLKAQSDLEKRPAYHFEKWDCLGWVVCQRPINPGALTCKSIRPNLDKILRDKRVLCTNGTYEPLHPLILKAFDHLVVKAGPPMMNDQEVESVDDADPQTVYDDADDEGGEKGTPTAQAAFTTSQLLMDAKSIIEELLAESEHKMGKKAMMKIADQLEQLAQKALAVGDKVVSDLNGTESSEEIDEEAEADAEEVEADDEDDEKKLKAFRAPHRKMYAKAVRRFTLKEVRAAKVVEDKAKDSPEDLERLKKARERYHKITTLYG